jgi:hypothetical protein
MDEQRPPKPPYQAQLFGYQHLPPHLQEVSKKFYDLAQDILKLPDNPERTRALDRLLESKDAAVRALVVKDWEWDDFAKRWYQPGAKGAAIDWGRKTGA